MRRPKQAHDQETNGFLFEYPFPLRTNCSHRRICRGRGESIIIEIINNFHKQTEYVITHPNVCRWAIKRFSVHVGYLFVFLQVILRPDTGRALEWPTNILLGCTPLIWISSYSLHPSMVFYKHTVHSLTHELITYMCIVSINTYTSTYGARDPCTECLSNADV